MYTLCFIFLNFWGISEPFMSFLDFTRFIFKFSFLLTHMSFWMVFMLVLRFLEILFEQWSQFKVEIVKIRKILGCLKFGSANSPRVRGGRSAIHETCLPEALQKSFKPQNYSADGPPKDRGRSADHRFNLQASDTPMGCLLSNARTVRQGPRTVRQGPRTVRPWCFQEDPDS